MDDVYQPLIDLGPLCPPPVNVLLLLVTRDLDLIGRLAESPRSDSMAIDCVDCPLLASLRLKVPGAAQVFAVDLSALGS